MRNNTLKVHFEIKLNLNDSINIKWDKDGLPDEEAEKLIVKKLKKKFGITSKNFICYPYKIEGKLKGKDVKYCKSYGSRGEPYFYDALKEN